MKNYSLLDRAKKDAWNARLVFAHWDGDELSYDIAAYHVQQAVEKSMKYVLSQNKVVFKKQHDAAFLKEQFEGNSIGLPEWFVPNMDTLDKFVTQARYGTDLVGARAKILELLGYVEEYIESIELEERKLQNGAEAAEMPDELAQPRQLP